MHHTFHKSSSISMSRFRSNAQSSNCEKRTLKKGVVRFHKFWLVNPTWSPLSPTIPSNSAFQSCIWPTHWIQYNWKRYYKLWILNKSRFNPYRVSQSEQQNFDTSFLKKVNCTAQRTNMLEQSSKNNSCVYHLLYCATHTQGRELLPWYSSVLGFVQPVDNQM